MKLRFQIYVEEHEITCGKQQQHLITLKKTPTNLIFYSWHYVNMRILLEINAGKHWKHVENIINAMLDLKTSSNFLLQRIFKFKYTFRVYKSLVFQ